MSSRFVLVSLFSTALGCVGSPSAGAPESREAAARSNARSEPVGDAAGSPRRSDAPAFLPAAEAGTVEQLVKEAQAARDGDGTRLLVYVGASWCEPCRRFHEAVESGALDGRLSGVRFLEFDADRDGDRLDQAGYGGRMIPRFAVPGPDGRGSGLKIEGGTKGNGAVEHIMARLEPLLGRTGRG